MSRRLLLSALLFAGLLTSPCVAQEDGKAWAKQQDLLLFETATSGLNADEAVSTDTRPDLAVWRRYVKPEKREQFEAVLSHFQDVGAEALADGRMSPEQARAFRNVRVLPPSGLNEWGSYTYLFLCLPYVEEAEHIVPDVLKMVSRPSNPQRLYRLYQDALTQNQSKGTLSQLP